MLTLRKRGDRPVEETVEERAKAKAGARVERH